MINRDRLVQQFLDLVSIDSPSGEEQNIASYLLKKLHALGGRGEKDTYGNLIVRFDGIGDPIMLNCHMDTVEPGRNIRPIVENDVIKTNGTTVLGGDAKTGLAIILETIMAAKEANKTHKSLEVVLTVEEELGLIGAMKLDYTKILAKKGLTFDGTKNIENITIAAPGYTKVDILTKGIAAHAGSEPEKGLSAIRIASELIAQLHLGRIDDETTANIGLISGGSARNTVPEMVEIKGEIRSRNRKKLQAHTQHFVDAISSTVKKYPHAQITPHISVEFEPYHFQNNNDLIREIKKTLQVLGLTFHEDFAGGGSDVNVLHQHGIEAVCVGIGDYNPHTTREFVKISEMEQAALFTEKFISI
jgi:tripeptide aminopeptidase